jgi:hypothetical protein
MCSICQKEAPVCKVCVFTTGVNDNGGRATQVIAVLCDDCVKAMLVGDLILTQPENTIRFENLWDK